MKINKTYSFLRINQALNLFRYEAVSYRRFYMFRKRGVVANKILFLIPLECSKKRKKRTKPSVKGNAEIFLPTDGFMICFPLFYLLFETFIFIFGKFKVKVKNLALKFTAVGEHTIFR